MGRASQQHVGGGPPRIFSHCVCVCFFIFFFSSLFTLVSFSILFHLSHLSLSPSHTFSFLTERFVFLRKKKSKKLAHSRLLGLSLTNLLFTLRLFCFSFFFLLFNADYYIALDFDSLSLSLTLNAHSVFFLFFLVVLYLSSSLFNSLRHVSLTHTRTHLTHALSLFLSLCYRYTRFASRLFLPSHSLSLSLSLCSVSTRISLDPSLSRTTRDLTCEQTRTSHVFYPSSRF